MKALRRSMKGEKDGKPHVSIAPKSAVAIVPPKKVIRALYDYDAQNNQELSFSRGDFFHVIGRENDPHWYEACNPALPDARGLVPVSFFQALGRTEGERNSRSSQSETPRPMTGSMTVKTPDHDSGYGDVTATSTLPVMSPHTVPGATSTVSNSSSRSGGRSGAMVYGIVMYDFQAERADELEAKAGEAIIVIAQSNPEWFVAKPIGRLGGPGLIPVSFIEIRDMASNTPVQDPQGAVRRAGIPRVEEWKKMAADYKNSSITLGKFEVGGAPSAPGQQREVSLEHDMGRMSLQQGHGRMSQSQSAQLSQPNAYAAKTTSQLYAPVSVHIPRYCFAEDKYWFVVEATLEDGRTWELSRYYEDFYDFQIALLTEFPDEAGNTGSQKRTLPYMPGPVNYVTDAITEGRLHNLDAYVKNLLAQPPYIARCNLVKQFFAPREGDYEIDAGTGNVEYRLSGASMPSSNESPADNQRQLSGPPQMARQVSSMSQPSQSSLTPGLQSAGAAIKVKLSHHGDLVAIRVPNDIQFRDLYQRILERLKISPSETGPALSYKDELTGDKLPMVSNNDLAVALQRNEKLLLYVE